MTTKEIAAFNAGVEAVRQMALIAAVTIETRADANEVRQRAAAAALQGLADGARDLLPACSQLEHAGSDHRLDLIGTETLERVD